MHNRKHGRVRARGIASHLHDGAQLITGLTVENLSRGGAYIRTDNPMPVGSAVVLDLVRPGLRKPLQLTGRVVTAVTPRMAQGRKGQPGMGIQFDPYPEALGVRLTELLLALGAGPAVLDADAPAVVLDVAPVQKVDPIPDPAPAAVSVPAEARLMVQVRGLLMELGDWQQKVAALERENAELKGEVERLKAKT